MTTLEGVLQRETARLERLHEDLNTLRRHLEREIEARLSHTWAAAGRPIAPIVYSRVKPTSSVQRRIEDRYSKLEDFPDLVGCRVVVLHSAEVNLVESCLQSLVRGIDRESVTYRTLRGRASGYAGRAYPKVPIAVSMEEFRGPADTTPTFDAATQNTPGLNWELQIHTAMQEAWSRLSHARFYKDERGVPYSSWRQLDRLAAVTDLVDEQLSLIDNGIDTERQRLQRAMMDIESRDQLRVDEYVLAQTQLVWGGHLERLRDMGQEAGLRTSEWPELIRVGDETDICIAVSNATGMRFVGQFYAYLEEVTKRATRTRNVRRLRETFVNERVDGTEDQRPFDRPLLVLSILRLMDNPGLIESVERLRPSIKERLVAARRVGVTGLGS